MADSCLMCGRCQSVCPVGIELDVIRTSVRYDRRKDSSSFDYGYIDAVHVPLATSKIGFFSGCMGRLTPSVAASMREIAARSGVDIWFVDEAEGICCGRPQRMAGNLDAADRMRERNEELLVESGIDTLVTSCPICLRTFLEDYHLDGIRLLHHSQFIAELMEQGLLAIRKGDASFVYHDPCELGRGLGIYDEPRAVLGNIGSLEEVVHSRDKSLCCGGSLAHLGLDIAQRDRIASGVCAEFEATGADFLVTSCPMCKKSLSRSTDMKVMDIAEAVAMGTHLAVGGDASFSVSPRVLG